MNREEKSHPDWTNREILEQANLENKKTKLSVTSLLIKSPCMNSIKSIQTDLHQMLVNSENVPPEINQPNL